MSLVRLIEKALNKLMSSNGFRADRVAGESVISPHLAGPYQPSLEVHTFAQELDIHPRLLQDVIFELEELRLMVDAVKAKAGCALLVFGCGNDSVFWESVNRDGMTVFLEDDAHWAEVIEQQLLRSPVHVVDYATKLSEWADLIDHPDRLAMDLPATITSRRWDVVIVDGPAGFDEDRPGRMKSIFAASQLVAERGRVFVHDCERPVEDAYSSRYLGAERLFIEREGRVLFRGYAF